MRLDTESLRTLKLAIELGSLTAVAGQLSMSLSAVSWKLKRLETKLGRKLFHKTGHKIEATADAQKLLGYAETIINAHDKAIQLFRLSDLQGRLIVGITDDIAANQLPIFVQEFHRGHPKIQLEIKVEQRKPIARIFNRNGYSVYIDDKGKTMQTSEFYTARVPVINGFVNIKSGEELSALTNDSLKNETLLDELYELTTYIRGNEFLKAQIEQIYVEKNGEIILIPKVGNQEIIFGKVEEIEKKFKKLLLFYKEGINPNNLNLYKTINLKFDNQIVCKKNK